MSKLPLIVVGDQVFAAAGGEEFGAVRDVAPAGRPELVVYVEGSGDFTVELAAVTKVHDHKVIVNLDALSPAMRAAVQRAHDAERL